MHAEGSSPPPSDSLPIGGLGAGTLLQNAAAIQAPAQSRSNKRKRPGGAAASPAPSDVNSNAGHGTNSTDLLATSRADLSSRPILTISRGPIFVPVSEGSEWYKTEMIGVNRIGYRYIPAGINPPGHAVPCRTIESNPTSFRVSWEDRSPLIKVTKDGLSLAGFKGFRSARCNAPMREGKWYMEVKILHGGGDKTSDDSKREGPHVRLGWGRREAPLNAPVGLDGYSYGYRDKTGEKVTLSRPRPYGRPFGTGDVIGMYISLPPKRQPNKKDPHDPAHLKRERIPIDLKGQEVFEILEYPQSKEMAALMDYSGKTTSSASVPSSNKKAANGKPTDRNGPAPPSNKPATPALRPLPTLSGSRIAFFVNGEPQGIAFEDLYDYLPLRQTETQQKNSRRRTREGVKEHRENPFDDGTLGYYPFISLFNEASVRLNPGPNFDFPPPDDIDDVLDKMGSTKADGTAVSPNVPPNSSLLNLEIPKEQDVKPQIDPTSQEAIPPAPPAPEPQKRTWRPACERYPEFMQEEWDFDALEEEEAKVELAKYAAAEKAEEEKRKQREKKRQQAEARRKAKKEAALAQQVADAASLEEERARTLERERFASLPAPPPGTLYGPGGHFPVVQPQPSPSPLRHFTAFEPEGSVDYENSPAPTYTSFSEQLGGQSGYTSENHEPEPMDQDPDDLDVDQDIEAIMGSPSRPRTPA